MARKRIYSHTNNNTATISIIKKSSDDKPVVPVIPIIPTDPIVPPIVVSYEENME
jgi:hypothetical protein